MLKKKLELKSISKKYTDKVGYTINLLNDISLKIDKNKFVSILAPVGSGKSSLLKIIAGLDNPTSGIVDSEFKKVVLIPSLPSSFPWLNVKQNISFNSHLDTDKIQNIINLVGLHGYEDHFPHTKSEGFRFRIALGRAIANKPEAIVIDEPFNNLNTTTRIEIYTLLRMVYSQLNIPFILGTTNITEAIFLSDYIYLMKKNPGQIIEKISIDLDDKREKDLLDSDSFISLRTSIENTFKERADRQLYNFSI